VVRDLVPMPQNHVRRPWEHAVVACGRADAPGDRAKIVRKNEGFAAELGGVVSDLDSGPLRLVGMAKTHTSIDLSLDAAAPEYAVG
jgi:hypothetical protein